MNREKEKKWPIAMGVALGLNAEGPKEGETPEQRKRREGGLEVLLDAVITGDNGAVAIRKQEKRGQETFNQSSQIPTDTLGVSDAHLERMGFKLGPVVADDPIWREGELPEGWRKRGTGHSLWTDIIDTEGRIRAQVFYKAAFYDRHCHMRLTPRYVSNSLYDTPDGEWEVGAGEKCRWVDNQTGEVIQEDTEFRHRPDFSAMEREEALRISRAQDEIRLGLEAWVKKNYPEYRDPTAYWEV